MGREIVGYKNIRQRRSYLDIQSNIAGKAATSNRRVSRTDNLIFVKFNQVFLQYPTPMAFLGHNGFNMQALHIKQSPNIPSVI